MEEERKGPLLIDNDQAQNANRAFEAMVGAENYQIAQAAAAHEDQDEAEYEDDDSDNEIDETSREVIKIVNVHKTYLLGIEGVPALRGVNLTV